MERRRFPVTHKLYRLWYRRRAYLRLVFRMFGRVPPADILRTQFPFSLPDARVPPFVTVELTNHCQLKCPYCTSPLVLRPQGIMSLETLGTLARQINMARISRVRIVGNGEATLHPHFAECVRQLGQSTGFLSLLTNGQHMPLNIKTAILDHVTMLELSVDSHNDTGYERSRPGARFDRLLQNLEELRRLKHQMKSSTMVTIRVMLRPSEISSHDRILEFWGSYADTVMPQFLVDVGGTDPDVYSNSGVEGVFPRCTLPFKALDVRWDGKVPLCSYSQRAGSPEGIILGNVNSNSLIEMWNSPLMKQYRRAHRDRVKELMPICGGCMGT